MPSPVTPWVTETFPTAKSLNLALYTCDGTNDNPNGIAFNAYRPILFDSYGTAVTFQSSSSGSQTSMSSPGPASTATTRSVVLYDTAGYFGQAADAPGGQGFYQFVATVNGSSGDGVTPGGWSIISHFVPVKPTGTQISVGADILSLAGSTLATTGSRQAPSPVADSCPFFLDIVNTGTATWQPAINLRDSAGSATTNAVNNTDSSGETCRFYSIWESVSATSTGQVIFNVNGIYDWVAPTGVATVIANIIGAGGGGGGGNQSGGGLFLGGGGGGGGEYSLDDISVTAGVNYTAIVGPGGGGGLPGTPGNPGGNSQFTGNDTSVVGHGGSGGGSASTSVSGSGGAGGTGSGSLRHFNGGSGAQGNRTGFSGTSVDGGGGGSSAGPNNTGTNATSGSGAPAPAGGGPGGNGGVVNVKVVQSGHNHGNDKIFTLNFHNPVQAGNTIIAAVIYQGSGASTDPTVTLDDGTVLTNQIAADLDSLSVAMQIVVYDIYNVSGGQQSVTVHGHGTASNSAIGLQIYEVAGLGPSPTIDQSSSNATGGAHSSLVNSYPPSGTTVPTSTQAPEFWFAAVGGQQLSSFNINPPASNQNWVSNVATEAANGGVFSRILSAYQINNKTGKMTFSGTITEKVSSGWLVLGYVSSADTSGLIPFVGPGGGGGAGLGTNGNGASGFDGSITLRWLSQPGEEYGNPNIPAPFSNWSDTTTIGVTDGVDVNINGNTGIRDVLNFLANPPIFRIASTLGGTTASSSVATIAFSGPGAPLGGTTPTVDNYSGWSGTANSYVIPRDGLYLCHGLVSFGASSGGSRQAAIVINGVSFWGPASPATSAGGQASPKTQIFSLQAGDAVQLACRQNSGSSLATSTTNQTRMFLSWLCEEGAPSGSWNPPDTTFRWASGTPGNQLVDLFQVHLANDLGFLCNRPYLLTYQGTAQTNLPQSTFSTITMDTVQGLIHNELGDNYSGWTAGAANSYTAPCNGWYLMVGEFFTAAAISSNGSVIAGVKPTTSGGVTPSVSVDWYQQLLATTAAQIGGGATVFGLQYLLTGESISPQINGNNFGGSYSTIIGAHNGGQFNSHFSMVWLSE